MDWSCFCYCDCSLCARVGAEGENVWPSCRNCPFETVECLGFFVQQRMRWGTLLYDFQIHQLAVARSLDCQLVAFVECETVLSFVVIFSKEDSFIQNKSWLRRMGNPRTQQSQAYRYNNDCNDKGLNLGNQGVTSHFLEAREKLSLIVVRERL